MKTEEITVDEYDLVVEITNYTAGDPGNYSGPWEDSWPAESPEIEFTVISGNHCADDGTERDLTAAECESVGRNLCCLIEEKLFQIIDDIDDESEVMESDWEDVA